MASSDAYYTCVTECPINKGYRYDSTTENCINATNTYTDGE